MRTEREREIKVSRMGLDLTDSVKSGQHFSAPDPTQLRIYFLTSGKKAGIIERYFGERGDCAFVSIAENERGNEPGVEGFL